MFKFRKHLLLSKETPIRCLLQAASIVARWLEIGDDNYELTYPGYDFAHNVGYGTQHHLEGLNERESLRTNFEPIKRMLEEVEDKRWLLLKF